MEMRKLPVCDYVYEFLLSPEEHSNILSVSNYAFAPGELASVLSFLSVSPSIVSKVHHLCLHNCRYLLPSGIDKPQFNPNFTPDLTQLNPNSYPGLVTT